MFLLRPGTRPYFPWGSQPYGHTGHGERNNSRNESEQVIPGEFEKPPSQPGTYGAPKSESNPDCSDGKSYLGPLENVRDRSGNGGGAEPIGHAQGYGIVIEHPGMGGIVNEGKNNYTGK